MHLKVETKKILVLKQGSEIINIASFSKDLKSSIMLHFPAPFHNFGFKLQFIRTPLNIKQVNNPESKNPVHGQANTKVFTKWIRESSGDIPDKELVPSTPKLTAPSLFSPQFSRKMRPIFPGKLAISPPQNPFRNRKNKFQK